MNTFDLGEWFVFDPSHQRKDKWQALKVLEESAEVVEAAKRTIGRHDLAYTSAKSVLCDEIADLLQTITNLCDAYGISENDLIVAQVECNHKNLERGMFQPGPRTHMHREGDDDD